MQFSRTAPEQVAAHITAPLHGYITLMLQRDAADMRAAGLVVTGNHEIAQQVQRYILSFDSDWFEEQLSKYTSDMVGYHALQTFKNMRGYAQENSHALGQMISEYLQDETKVLPSSMEVQDFIDEVDALRLRVDRLEANIALYRNKQHESY
jgi:ubiquinone biosynthesis protein UbiJ